MTEIIPKSAPKERTVPDADESDVDDDVDESDSDDDSVELAPHLRQSPEERQQVTGFCAKEIIAKGIHTMAIIAETACKPSLNGYQDNVMNCHELNLVCDQLAIEYNEYLGIADLSPTMQLFLCLSVVGLQTYGLNMASTTLHGVPRPPSQMSLFGPTPQQQQEVIRNPQSAPPPVNLSFAPAYSD
jgi:hypothetical protein